ncbi:GNAT family N-acetyltransferase [Chitinimonas sp.]|uniref:GNAT family N-acetyltransferase n=1 Tax=Chitinimonas sp. TaxID=1934313 RepID=UPI002F95173C
MSAIDTPETELFLVSQLHRSDAPAMLEHLLGLGEADRTQRFNQSCGTAAIEHYVAGLEYDRDAHYGVWLPERQRLIGLTHLAIDSQYRFAEIGVSVDAGFRRRGVASRMLKRAILHACNHGVAEVVMYFLPYNTELIELARRQGMRLSVGNGEGIARLAAREPSVGSLAAEWLESMGELTTRSLQHLADGSSEAGEQFKKALRAE